MGLCQSLRRKKWQGNLSWDTAEAYALLVPGCPRDAGRVAQIQSTPRASSWALHPPNCLFSPAFRTVTPPKTSLCSPSAVSLLILATKERASVNSPVDIATQGGPGGNPYWEEPAPHAWEMGCYNICGFDLAPQSRGWGRKVCLHGSPHPRGKALWDADPAQGNGSSPLSALCLPLLSGIPGTSRDKRSPEQMEISCRVARSPLPGPLPNPPLPSSGGQFPGPVLSKRTPSSDASPPAPH